jgi:hypothetical protein
MPGCRNYVNHERMNLEYLSGVSEHDRPSTDRVDTVMLVLFRGLGQSYSSLLMHVRT